MSITKRLVVALIMLWVSGCSKPLPQDKSAYAGEWRGDSMSLDISPEGRVRYKRSQDGVSKSIDAPLKTFEGDNFVVGIGPMSTTFVVSAPPHQDGWDWKMTVDGVELTRK